MKSCRHRRGKVIKKMEKSTMHIIRFIYSSCSLNIHSITVSLSYLEKLKIKFEWDRMWSDIICENYDKTLVGYKPFIYHTRHMHFMFRQERQTEIIFFLYIVLAKYIQLTSNQSRNRYEIGYFIALDGKCMRLNFHFVVIGYACMAMCTSAHKIIHLIALWPVSILLENVRYCVVPWNGITSISY